ncbi:MAG: hypothetical protein U0892_17650 [Pirellulales bacterium]
MKHVYRWLRYSLCLIAACLMYYPAEANQAPVGSQAPAQRRLTAEEARALVARASMKLGLNLDHITSLDIDVAKELTRCPGLLSLNGLTVLDASTAEALTAEMKGGLRLNGLTELSPKAATALAKQDYIELNQLQPHRSVLVELGKMRGILQLNGIHSLDAESAAELAAGPTRLSLDGLLELDAMTARQLASSKAFISVDSLTSVSDGVADEMAMHSTGWSLKGLKSLTHPRLAAALSATPNNIELFKVETLDVNCLESLTRGEGSLTLGLFELPVEQARVLAKSSRRLTLLNVAKLSSEQIDLFVQSGVRMSLPGLTELTDVRLASKLAKDAGSLLDLRKLQAIPDDVAFELAQGRAILLLSGLKNLSTPMARSLADYRGNLNLTGLTNLTDEASECFRSRQRTLFLSEQTQMSEAAQTSLKANPKIVFRNSSDQ